MRTSDKIGRLVATVIAIALIARLILGKPGWFTGTVAFAVILFAAITILIYIANRFINGNNKGIPKKG